jgi:hypothetical protein
MGLKLSGAFARAGLPAPELIMDAIAGGGKDFIAYDWAEETMRALLPSVERLGVATAGEVQVETFAERLRAEANELGAGALWPPFVSAWTQTT